MKKRIVFSIVLTAMSFCTYAQNKPSKVVWGNKIKKAKNLTEFIYANNKLFTLNKKLKSVQMYSPSTFNLEKNLELSNLKGKLGSQTINLFESTEMLIKHKESFGLFTVYYDNKSNSKIFAFFKIKADLSDVDLNGKILYKIELGKNVAYQGSLIYKDASNENFQAIASYKSDEKKGFLLNIICSEGKIISEIFTDSYFSESGKLFIYAENCFIIHSLEENKNVVTLYNGRSGSVISNINLSDFLDYDSRIFGIKQLKDKTYVLAGVYGKLNEEETNIYGLFKIKLDSKGQIIMKSSETFVFSEINSTQSTIIVQDLIITNNGDIYYVLTSMGEEKALYSQLMVIGIQLDEIWAKAIPFRQGVGTVYYPDHLGIKAQENNGNLLLLYNDNKKNHQDFNYNHYSYSRSNVPHKYTCSVPDACTVLDISNTGRIDSYMIDFYDVFTNLKAIKVLNDGSIFVSANTATPLGAGKPKFARIELK